MKGISLTVIAVTGFAGSVGQIMIVRELLVLFHGNELSTGLVFTAWLIWIAAGSGLGGKLSSRIPSVATPLALALIFLALTLPVTILWIRASRLFWNIPLGELLPPGKMLGISFSATWLFCLVSGFLFPLTWSVYINSETRNQVSSFKFQVSSFKFQPVFIYLSEALGAASGGLFFYFILLPYMSILASAFITSGIMLAVAAVLPWFDIKNTEKTDTEETGFFQKTRFLTSLLIFVFVSMATVSFFLPRLDHLSRQWQWGKNLVTVRDTPYNNLALIKEKNLFTLFANGLWAFSSPDPQTAEKSVHLALLQHPHPKRVLLISGGVAGLVDEILKHHDITRVDYIEPDPDLIRLAEDYLPAPGTMLLVTAEIHMFHEDAGTFIRQQGHTYDVILMNVGDPVNAQMNRFYTVEFYRQIKKRLNPGGIFSFAVSSSPEMLGTAQVKFLQSVFATITGVFPQVSVYAGDNARFFATDTQGKLVTDANELIARITEKNLQLKYVRDYYLFDILDPFRMDYFRTLLTENSGEKDRPKMNRNLAPTCYFNNLVLWGTQIHKGFKKFLILLSEKQMWLLATAIILCAVAAIGAGYSGTAKATGLCVMAVGGMEMALEIVIILGFQIMAGFVYKQLALIIAFFMAGLGLGTGLVAWFSKYRQASVFFPARAQTWLILVQAVLCFYLIGITGLLYLLQNLIIPVGRIFSVLAFIGGILGGSHFSLAVKTVSGQATPSAMTGGGLYALDITGSAGGALAASLFLLPLYGVATTLVLFSMFGFGSLLALIFSKKTT
ncbi:MAG: hypothetical protein GY795_18125 [Desulfobacterales bacterium]|nr:hypothetical protein [Desulfobacterales bacterium]